MILDVTFSSTFANLQSSNRKIPAILILHRFCKDNTILRALMLDDEAHTQEIVELLIKISKHTLTLPDHQ